jgi:murein DD-endopeptidase MepM/ murein hydrolase activator NlpD
MSELFVKSKIVVLDFSQIAENVADAGNIEAFFRRTTEKGENPREPQLRQRFNDDMINATGCRYLVGRYGEDRIAMLTDTPAGRSGRTIHMALDIFSKNLEPVYSPCDAEIIASDYEQGFGEYGNYLILKPSDEKYYIFLGHLGKDRVGVGAVNKGQQIAHLGSWENNENGGWSRHLHLQILKKLSKNGSTPDGYSSREDYSANSLLYPDPMTYFPKWKVK